MASLSGNRPNPAIWPSGDAVRVEYAAPGGIHAVE